MVIFVTHGAGRTALIHASSGLATEELPYIQPSSLSMARCEEKSNEGDGSGKSAAGSCDMVLVNSLRHLQE